MTWGVPQQSAQLNDFPKFTQNPDTTCIVYVEDTKL